MKTKEELNKLKAEVETLNKKLAELTKEDLEQVTGGLEPPVIAPPVIAPPVIAPPDLDIEYPVIAPPVSEPPRP